MNELEAFLVKDAKYVPTPALTPTPAFKIKPLSLDRPMLTPVGINSLSAEAPGYDRDAEYKMWSDWKASGEDPKKLEPLMKSMGGIVQRTVSTYTAADIDDNFVRAEAEKKVLESLKDYDPSKGAKLSTHVLNRQKRVGRFVKNHQNFARVVEGRAANWSEYQEARKEIQEAKGRDPSREELSALLSAKLKAKGKKKWKVSASEAGRYMAEDRRDLVHSGLDKDSFVTMPTQDRLVLKMVEEELTPEERAVYERMFGLNGAPKQGPGAIARSLRIHPSKVSRISASIAKKVEAYY